MYQPPGFGRTSALAIIVLAMAPTEVARGQADLSAQLLSDMRAAMGQSFRGTLEYECIKTRPADAGALMLYNDLATRQPLVTGNAAVDAVNAQRFEAIRADLWNQAHQAHVLIERRRLTVDDEASLRLDDFGARSFDSSPDRCIGATPVASWLHRAGTSEIVYSGPVSAITLPSNPLQAEIHSLVRNERYTYALFVNNGMPPETWTGAALGGVTLTPDQVVNATVTRPSGDSWATRFIRFQDKWVLSEASVTTDGWHSTIRLAGYHDRCGLVLPAEVTVTMLPPGSTEAKVDRYVLLSVCAQGTAEIRDRLASPTNDISGGSDIRIERRLIGGSESVIVRESGEWLESAERGN
jgi:hypothetical protein